MVIERGEILAVPPGRREGRMADASDERKPEEGADERRSRER